MNISGKRNKHLLTSVIEHLEMRALPSGSQVAGAVAYLPAADPGDVLPLAFDLGMIRNNRGVQVAGEIDRSGRDVDWYQITVAEASTLTVSATNGVVGLYNAAANDALDWLNPDGYRLLAQASAAGDTPAEISRSVAAGTYFIAVSGTGNLYFHPAIAASGIAGATQHYALTVEATTLQLGSNVPVILATDVTPLMARFNLSRAMDFTPVIRLIDAAGNDVAVRSTNFNAETFELQVAPIRPFATEFYELIVSDANGQQRLNTKFLPTPNQAGEAGLQGNDTPATAISLGDLTRAGLLQITGTIGDDPYDASTLDEPSVQPGSDVDLYHFVITAEGRIGLQAEVFAGRLGSALDVGLSLYYQDPLTGHLLFIAGNDDTYNPTATTDGTTPLAFDAALAAGLIAGDYYIAVSEGSNTPSPAEFQTRDTNPGIFDPEIAHSGSVGFSVGGYVLNLQVIDLPAAPEVVSTSITEGSVLASAPTHLNVKFNEFIDLTQQAFYAFQRTSQSTLSGVYVQDAAGQKYFPRLVGLDAADLTAQFLMLDRLHPGNYQLHLSGEQGLTNLIGERLVGNSLSGDYVVTFTVAEATGENTDPDFPVRFRSDPVTSLGVLFPLELQAGIQFSRGPRDLADGARDRGDNYVFEVLQNQSYAIHLNGLVDSSVVLQLFDADGTQLETVSPDTQTLVAQLQPGKYLVRVGNWPKSASAGINYSLSFNLLGIADNAPPLRSGPAPAVGLRLAGTPTVPSGGGSATNSSGGDAGVGVGRLISNPSGIGGSRNNSLYSPLANSLSLDQLEPHRGTNTNSGTALAIPAHRNRVTGHTLNESRLIHGRTPLKNQLTITGLSQLSDGLVGRSGTGHAGQTISQTPVKQLSRLVGSALSDDTQMTRKNERRDSEKPDQDITSAPRPEQTDPDRNEDLPVKTAEADYSEGNPESANDPRVAPAQPVSLQTPRTHGIRLADEDLIALLTSQDDEPMEADSVTPDQMFAAGFGMLVLSRATDDGTTKPTRARNRDRQGRPHS